MRKPSHVLSGIASALCVLGAARAALAQADVNPPPPNVLLLVDSSGSMEYKSSIQYDSSGNVLPVPYPAPAPAQPVCTPGTIGTSEKSRWINLIEVLTGAIDNYSCQAIDRNTDPAFSTGPGEFGLGGNTPADFGYLLGYHRPLSGIEGCGPGPGALPPASNVFLWPDAPAVNPLYTAYVEHLYTGASNVCAGGFYTHQGPGLIDNFDDQVRFGLMTFDTAPNAETGHSSANADYPGGIKGLWSYYVGSKHQGNPADCTTGATDMEVGARNTAAPLWEGRMINFGPPSQAPHELNSEIQKVLITTRPFGATPLAGFLDDARAFLQQDATTDPRFPVDPVTGAANEFGPMHDPYVEGKCRSNTVVLLSDGEPNLDLRPECAKTANDPSHPGQCPYQQPWDIADDLFNSIPSIKTFVIGFAASDFTLANGTHISDCTTLSQSDLDPTNPGGLCGANPNERQLQACCALNRVAYSGGTDHAYFTSDPEQVGFHLSQILTGLTSTITSRTLPIFAGGGSARDSFAGAYRFFSSMKVTTVGLRAGVLERQRYICDATTGVPAPSTISDTSGDDFAANVNSGSGPARKFLSAAADPISAVPYSDRSVRPDLAAADNDGAGVVGGTPYEGDASTFTSQTSWSLMSTASTCGIGSGATCRDHYLKWLVGLNNGTANNRCAAPGSPTCSLLGAIFHSTPQSVGTPGEFLRDESYAKFAAANLRPLVLYFSTNDGFLHAFKVAPKPGDTQLVDTKTNNELWAFIPPAVLPDVAAFYPGKSTQLLDRPVVVKDVIAFDVNQKDSLLRPKYRLDRDRDGARNAGTDPLVTWRTVLVTGFSGTKSGYFALDVTDPEDGPRFLWQLTKDSLGNPLFGDSAGTPLITTMFFGNPAKEVAVAVLPGGKSDTTSTACTRANGSPGTVDSAYLPRTQVRCYASASAGGARSLTIARLDTGEIVRTFRRATADAPAAMASVVSVADLDSPITGQPIAFPSETGSIADRVFVGDADGTLWRVDVSSTDPAKWEMKMFFDLYTLEAATSAAPIQTPPVLSVDTSGALTVAVSTGDQEAHFDPTGNNYLFSLTEELNGTSFKSKVNWYNKWTAGERVAGPISLFAGTLYFSTYKPGDSSSDVCSNGTAAVYGLDYLVPHLASDLAQGGEWRFPAPGGLVDKIDSTSALINGATIFGVGIQQLPSCNQVDTGFSDPYLGYGSHTSLKAVNPGTFQLVMETGASGGTSQPGGQTNTVEINLPAPPTTARVDSWAAIVE